MNSLTAEEDWKFERLWFMIERKDTAKAKALLAEYPKLVNYPETFNTAISLGHIELARHLVGLGVRCTNRELKLAQLRYDQHHKGSLEVLNFVKECRQTQTTEEDLEQKKIQEAHETNIAALNSTTLGQKLPEDVIRKVSEYGGRKKRKTRKRKSNNRKTIRRRK